MAGPETCSPGNFLDFYVPWRILAAQTVHISTFAIGTHQYWITGIVGNNRVAFVATE